MLAKVRSVGIYVSGQQRPLRFYTDVLGCELTDPPMGPEPDAPHWIEVRLPRDTTKLILFTLLSQKTGSARSRMACKAKADGQAGFPSLGLDTDR